MSAMDFTNVDVAIRRKPSTTMRGISSSEPTMAPANVDATVKVEPSDSMDDPALIPNILESAPQTTERDQHNAVILNSSATICSSDAEEKSDSMVLKGEARDVVVKAEPSRAPNDITLPGFVKPTEDAAAPDFVQCSESVEDALPREFVEAYETLEDATLVGLPETKAPSTPNEFNKFRFDPKYQAYPHRQVIGIYVSHLSRNERELPPGGHQAVQNMLKSLFKIEGLTPEIDRDYRYTWILNTIIGESDQATAPYAFPPILAEQASIVLDHFQDDLNIGVEIDSSPTPPPPVPATSTNTKVNNKAGERMSTSKKRKAANISTSDPIQCKPFDMENPKVAGMMHNMQRGPRGGPKMKDPTLKRDYNKFGHNGLSVGDWWPYQACALRDGAHGSSMGGIAGGARDGAKSIVVGGKSKTFPNHMTAKLTTGIGGYEGMDKDEGNVIYYSGSNSHQNEDRDTPHISNATKSLQRAMLDNRHIRVLRSAKGDSRFAPAVGIRYDGLYKIVGEEKRWNAKGGAYLRFKLVRVDGQAGIDTARPDLGERRAFAGLKGGG